MRRKLPSMALLLTALVALPPAASAVVLTGPPPPDQATTSNTVCHAAVTVTVGITTVTGQPVCATATATTTFGCAPSSPGRVACTMTITLTGGGHSPLLLPGAYRWDGGAGFIVCDGNEDDLATGPWCLGLDALWFDEQGSWPGATTSQASHGHSLSQTIDMPLGTPIVTPYCYLLSAGGGLSVTAKVVVGGMVSAASASASAGSGMSKAYCD